jgi:hypothetical protein
MAGRGQEVRGTPVSFPVDMVHWLNLPCGVSLPTLVQVFGVVKSKHLYATVYEDGKSKILCTSCLGVDNF